MSYKEPQVRYMRLRKKRPRYLQALIVRYKKLQSWFEKILPYEVRITLLVFLVFVVIVVLPSYFSGWYTKAGVWDSILVEAHGMIFDILIIGLLITWFTKKKEEQNLIEELKSEIDDLRSRPSSETPHRIRKLAAKLNKKDVTDISLQYCNLSGITLGDVSLKGADLFKADLRKADLTATNFQGASLIEVNAQQADFCFAYLQSANFKNANLAGAKFVFANFQNTKLEGANLEGANLLSAEFLTVEQLSKVKTLYQAQIDSKIIDQLQKEYPQLFVKA